MFDQKVDVIQDLLFTIVDSSTFTSSLDTIIHNYLSTSHDDIASSISHSPHILQLQTAVQTLQNLTSSPSLTLPPVITHHIENSPTIVCLQQLVTDLQTIPVKIFIMLLAFTSCLPKTFISVVYSNFLIKLLWLVICYRILKPSLMLFTPILAQSPKITFFIQNIKIYMTISIFIPTYALLRKFLL